MASDLRWCLLIDHNVLKQCLFFCIEDIGRIGESAMIQKYASIIRHIIDMAEYTKLVFETGKQYQIISSGCSSKTTRVKTLAWSCFSGMLRDYAGMPVRKHGDKPYVSNL